MRKIKRLSHLRYEQKRLSRQKADLEKLIRRDWEDLRRGFEPASFAKDTLLSGLRWIVGRLLPTQSTNFRTRKTADKEGP